MSDYQQAPKPVKRKNALNNPKLRLGAPNPAVKGVYAQLEWDVYQNNPRIVVNTKDPAMMNKESGFGRITAALDSVVFGVFLNMLQDAIAATEAVKYKIESFNFDWTNGQKSQEPVHLSDLWVGKDSEGCVFMSVVSKKPGFAVIKFVFNVSDQRWHKFFKGDGTPFTKAEISVLVARAYLRDLPVLMASVLDTHFFEAPPNDSWKQKQGGGGGGYNKPQYGGGGGGYSKPAPAAPAGGFDDGGDVPF